MVCGYAETGETEHQHLGKPRGGGFGRGAGFDQVDHQHLAQTQPVGEADMGRYMVMLDDIKLEEAALAEGDSVVINAPYSHLVNEAVRDDIAERRAAVEWKFKRAAIAVWMYRTEANRRGLL